MKSARAGAPQQRRSPPMMTSHRAALTLGLFTALAIGACNREEGPGDAGIADLSAEQDLAGDLSMGPDLACTPMVQSCTGLCGPVRDDCTGATFQCGACPSGLVCDLNGTHTCITPKVNCT